MKYECVIWDWNGTLLDDVRMNIGVFNNLMRDYGKREISLEEYQAKFRFPVIEFYEDMGFDFKKYDYKKVGEHFISLYNARRFECALTEGAENTLHYLQLRGIRQCILSAYERTHLKSAVEHYKIQNYFDYICGLENIYAASKIELGKSLVKQLNIKPQRILMVGDTDHDKKVAEAIGIDCAMLTCGHNSRERLEAIESKVFDTQAQLLEFLKFNS